MPIPETTSLFGFDLSTVPDIDFCVKDASLIESDVIGSYQNFFYLVTQLNKTLGRADPVRLFLLSIIYQIVAQRSIVDSTGKQNLIKYAVGANLDNVGARWGPTRGKRLPSIKALTTLEFAISTVLPFDVEIPIGTLAQTSDGIQFQTTLAASIIAGTLTVDIPAEAVIAGVAPNGLAVDTVNDIVNWDTTPYLVGVTNITIPSGGSDVESDDHFRPRVWMAPESFPTTGSSGAYEWWAASANANIIDVSVWSDIAHAGQVYIYLLMTGGRLPTTDECLQVYNICSADKVRPLTDQVFVQAPTPVPFTIAATYYIDSAKSVFEIPIKAAVAQAYQDYLAWQKSTIGLNINPAQMVKMLLEAGAMVVDIVTPPMNHVGNIVSPQQVAAASLTSALTYGGLLDG